MMSVGWSSVIVTALVIGGFQFVALGMLGEYLGRALLTAIGRPQLVVGDTAGLAPPRNLQPSRVG
jgi:hypothetical protein